MTQSKTKIMKISNKVVIATCTFYDLNSKSDRCRAELAISTIKKVVSVGYEVMVVDNGSSKKLLKKFEDIGVHIFKQTLKGIGNGRRQAFREAYKTGGGTIVWMEPEKVSYISQILKTIKPILENRADLVIPKRKSLKSYPTAQQLAEPLGNAFWKELTGKELDMWFGPRVWRRDISQYFLDYKGDYGDKWDSTFIPVMNAIHDGKKVISVDVDYVHPKKQRDIEEHDTGFYKKRIEQLNNLFVALETHWKKLHK